MDRDSFARMSPASWIRGAGLARVTDYQQWKFQRFTTEAAKGSTNTSPSRLTARRYLFRMFLAPFRSAFTGMLYCLHFSLLQNRLRAQVQLKTPQWSDS
ncbi:MAG: hypothetical protein ACXAEU_03515 [Candidatus Hodarchaeales archaeon]